MRSRLLVSLMFSFIAIFVFGQQKMIFPDLNGRKSAVNDGSGLLTSPCIGTLNPHNISDDWNIVLKNFSSFDHAASIPVQAFKALKKQVNDKRNSSEKEYEGIDQRFSTDPPLLSRNFRGNIRGSGVPMDNSMAISRNGFIVSAINSNVIFAGPDGKVTFTKGFPDFFKLLNLGTRMYDPRVIYDVEQNKFIFMVLHGSEPSNTFLCIAFSKTEDPNGDWNYYKVDGNPSGDDRWFDYPNIAISKSDFYISGLMRDLPGDWQYSVVYQIDKNAGFESKPLTWKYYNDLKDADGLPSFNLVPTPCGWDYLIGPGMYFVSNNANGGNTYNLYYTTGSLSENPSMVSLQATGRVTELAPDGRQKNTANVLNTFDSRLWSALYLNGTIHMGSHVNTPNGDVGLFYGRMKVDNLELYTDVFTTAGRDYGFPSFSAFGDKETDDDILVNYLVAGPDIFPGQEQRLCKGISSFEWSGAVVLKEGVGFVNALEDNNERWGDYTTSCRRFFDGRVENWVTGCFGESSSYGTWLGQFHRPEDEMNKPMGEFSADITTTPKGSKINFSDLTNKNPNSWIWTFEGGTPATSTDKNPIVTYETDGAYDVTLIVTNDLGVDTITKEDYIHIQDAEVAPIANFTYDKDTIYIDDLVQFTNLSSPNTVNFKWTFISGTPSASNEKDPLVKYTKVGSFLVVLSAVNLVGSNAKTVSKAVTVLNRSIPKASFTSDNQTITPNGAIHFTDMSTGGPKTRKWIFEGGTPDQSSEANPIINYTTEGKYDVTLVVENELGKDSITLSDYITVGSSSLGDINLISDFVLYPNPVQNDLVTVDFTITKTQTYRVEITDPQGRNVKTLYNDKIKSGPNRLTFYTHNLGAGTYYLLINDGIKIVKAVPLSIVY